MDLNKVVNDLKPIVESFLSSNIDINFELSPSPPVILADQSLLEQVLLNLVTNARDSFDDGGTINIKTYREEIKKKNIEKRGFIHSGYHAVLQVSDTGSGIEEHEKEKVFEPFFSTKPMGRGDRARSFNSLRNCKKS